MCLAPKLFLMGDGYWPLLLGFCLACGIVSPVKAETNCGGHLIALLTEASNDQFIAKLCSVVPTEYVNVVCPSPNKETALTGPHLLQNRNWHFQSLGIQRGFWANENFWSITGTGKLVTFDIIVRKIIGRRWFSFENFPVGVIAHCFSWSRSAVFPFWHNNQSVIQHMGFKQGDEYESSLSNSESLFRIADTSPQESGLQSPNYNEGGREQRERISPFETLALSFCTLILSFHFQITGYFNIHRRRRFPNFITASIGSILAFGGADALTFDGWDLLWRLL